MIATQSQIESTLVSSNRSESIAGLTKALIEFHKKGIKIPKSSRNPFLKTKYADLSTILDHVDPILSEVGLAILQMPVGEHELTTMLLHESGEFIESTYRMQPLESVVDKDNKIKAITPQSIGSVITYQRRYAIGAFLNLNIDDDTDGNPTGDQVTSESAAPAAPKKTAAEILAEKKAAKAAGSSGATATTADPATPANSTVDPKTSSASQSTANDTARSVSDKCTDDDVAEIKGLLSKLEQTQKGVSAEFVKRLKASGRQKIADFTIAEAQQVKTAIEKADVEAFFEKSLAKAANTATASAA